MKPKHLYILLGITAIGFLFSSFKFDMDESPFSPDDPEVQVDVQERIKAFKRKKRKECQIELMEEVDAKVDTILMFNKNDYLIQDNIIPIPDKPGRPEQPEMIEPKDSTPLQPLIDEDSVFQDIDTLEKKTSLDVFQK